VSLDGVATPKVLISMDEDADEDEPTGARPRDLQAWGRWIRLLRTARGLTQEELGRLAGTDKNTIGRIERGEKNVGVAYVWRLARALGVRAQDLFPDEEDAAPAQARRLASRD
jgi:DNA-binding XRE family transcriptional regulator